MRKFFLNYAALIFLSSPALSDETVYDRSTALDYFQKVGNVALVVKVGGDTSFDEYVRYFSELSTPKEDLYEWWRGLDRTGYIELLVLKVYKGDLVKGEIIKVVQNSHRGLIENGELKIVLMERVGSKYEFGTCDVFNYENFRKIKDVNKIFHAMASSHENACLYKVEYDDQE